MENHKKIVLGALVLTAVATTASMVAYMTSVSSRSKAATREDIQKLVQSIYPSAAPAKPLLAPKLIVDKQVVKSAGSANLKSQASSVDNSKLHLEFTNTTGKEMKGAKVVFRVSGTSTFAVGPASGAKPVTNGPKLKKGHIAYILPDLKPGETAKIDVPFVVRSPGASMKVSALLLAPGAKSAVTQPVTIRSN